MSLRVGQEAPDFTATAVYDQEFKDITLSSYKGKWVVLFFYPLDFTFVCPTEITSFSDQYDKFSLLETDSMYTAACVGCVFRQCDHFSTKRKI